MDIESDHEPKESSVDLEGRHDSIRKSFEADDIDVTDENTVSSTSRKEQSTIEPMDSFVENNIANSSSQQSVSEIDIQLPSSEPKEGVKEESNLIESNSLDNVQEINPQNTIGDKSAHTEEESSNDNLVKITAGTIISDIMDEPVVDEDDKLSEEDLSKEDLETTLKGDENYSSSQNEIYDNDETIPKPPSPEVEKIETSTSVENAYITNSQYNDTLDMEDQTSDLITTFEHENEDHEVHEVPSIHGMEGTFETVNLTSEAGNEKEFNNDSVVLNTTPKEMQISSLDAVDKLEDKPVSNDNIKANIESSTTVDRASSQLESENNESTFFVHNQNSSGQHQTLDFVASKPVTDTPELSKENTLVSSENLNDPKPNLPETEVDFGEPLEVEAPSFVVQNNSAVQPTTQKTSEDSTDLHTNEIPNVAQPPSSFEKENNKDTSKLENPDISSSPLSPTEDLFPNDPEEENLFSAALGLNSNTGSQPSETQSKPSIDPSESITVTDNQDSLLFSQLTNNALQAENATKVSENTINDEELIDDSEFTSLMSNFLESSTVQTNKYLPKSSASPPANAPIVSSDVHKNENAGTARRAPQSGAFVASKAKYSSPYDLPEEIVQVAQQKRSVSQNYNRQYSFQPRPATPSNPPRSLPPPSGQVNAPMSQTPNPISFAHQHGTPLATPTMRANSFNSYPASSAEPIRRPATTTVGHTPNLYSPKTNTYNSRHMAYEMTKSHINVISPGPSLQVNAPYTPTSGELGNKVSNPTKEFVSTSSYAPAANTRNAIIREPGILSPLSPRVQPVLSRRESIISMGSSASSYVPLEIAPRPMSSLEHTMNSAMSPGNLQRTANLYKPMTTPNAYNIKNSNQRETKYPYQPQAINYSEVTQPGSSSLPTSGEEANIIRSPGFTPLAAQKDATVYTPSHAQATLYGNMDNNDRDNEGIHDILQSDMEPVLPPHNSAYHANAPVSSHSEGLNNRLPISPLPPQLHKTGTPSHQHGFDTAETTANQYAPSIPPNFNPNVSIDTMTEGVALPSATLDSDKSSLHKRSAELSRNNSPRPDFLPLPSQPLLHSNLHSPVSPVVNSNEDSRLKFLSTQRPAFSFGPCGTIVMAFSTPSGLYTTSGKGTKFIAGPIKIEKLGDVLTDEYRHLKEFKGPYLASNGKVDKHGKAEAIEWLSKYIDRLNQSLEYDDKNITLKDKLLLLQCLKMLLEVSDRKLIVEKLRPILLPSFEIPEPCNTATSVQELINPEINQDDSPIVASRYCTTSFLHRFYEYLLSGNKDEALTYALQQKQWPYAIIVAHSIDAKTFQGVVRTFCKSEVKESMLRSGVGVNLQLSLQLMSDAHASSMSEFSSSTSLLNLADQSQASNALVAWKELLYNIIANHYSDQKEALRVLGTLLLQENRVYAAHLVYILSLSPDVCSNKSNSLFELVGLSKHNLYPSHDDLFDATQLTEVLELVFNVYSEKTPVFFTHLVPYRLYEAEVLAEAGEVSAARKYCELIGNYLNRVAKKSNNVDPGFVLRVRDLTQQILENSAGSEDISSSWLGRTVSRPRLDTVLSSLGSKFSKFVAGDPNFDVMRPATVGPGPFGKVASQKNLTVQTNTNNAAMESFYSDRPTSSGPSYQNRTPLTGQESMNMGVYSPYRRSTEIAENMSMDGNAYPYTPASQENPYTPRHSQEDNASVLSQQPLTFYSNVADNPYMPVSASQEPKMGMGTAFNMPTNEVHGVGAEMASPYQPLQPASAHLPNLQPTLAPINQNAYVPSNIAPAMGAMQSAPGAEAVAAPSESLNLNKDRSQQAKQAAAQNVADLVRQEEEKEKEKQKAKKNAESGKKGGAKGWFSKLLRRDESKDQPTVYKAKLGEKSHLHYDKELKRWVNDDGSDLSNQAAPPPPPPMALPKAGPPSAAPTSALPPAGPPAGATAISGNPGMPAPAPLTGKETAVPLSSMPNAPPSVASNAKLPPASNNRKVDPLEDILQAMPPPTTRKARGKTSKRYVDVMRNS